MRWFLLLLLLGLAALAVLQYRWIDRVSDAERQRMRANIDFAARRFGEDLRAELESLFEAFARPEGPDLAQRYDDWTRNAQHPNLIANIYVLDRDENGPSLRRFDRDSGELVDAAWPRWLEEVWRVRSLPPFLGEVPAMVIAPRRGPPFGGAPFEEPPPPDAMPRTTFIELDRAVLSTALLPRLASQHFSSGNDSYVIAVLRGSEVLYRSDASWPDGRTPPDFEQQFLPIDPARRGGPPERRRDAGRPRFAREIEPWRLLVRRRDGGLEALVASARRRNLALSFGILSILAATMLVLLALLRRADRLRAQQTQFVAAMTHELNTPIAALRAAGENLKDGIVGDGEKLTRYGETIVRESARLGEMVAQVLDFAGIQARTSRAPHEPVDLHAVIAEAVAQCRWLVDGSAVDVETNIADDLPPVRGDAQALTRAIQNLVANAIRHGGEGKWVGVSASRNGNGVAISVEDRGPGIDGRDAAHLFEPFYRGRNSGRVRGAGLGLSIVQQIARAHGGSVDVDRRRRTGAAFTLHLPAAVDRV